MDDTNSYMFTNNNFSEKNIHKMDDDIEDVIKDTTETIVEIITEKSILVPCRPGCSKMIFFFRFNLTFRPETYRENYHNSEDGKMGWRPTFRREKRECCRSPRQQ